MAAPSTEWRETIAADEDARFQRHAEAIVEIQRRGNAHGGAGRGLHRKQHLGLSATLDVADGLPPHARHGLFARPGRYDAQLRLSNGAPRRHPDPRPDVRGFAIRVLGVEGEGALGGPCAAQCFLLINSATFAFAGVDAFMRIALAVERGQLAVLRQLQRDHGFFGGLREARRLGAAMARPFAGFAREPFHSAAPIACGPYAAKVRLVGVDTAGLAPARRDDWAADVVATLATRALRWDLQLQFFVDETTTPIEDPRVEWPEAQAPFVTVARLEAPVQDPASDDGRAVAAAIEAGVFDPWQALAAHRPLGEIMRARKVAYYASQRERGAV